MRGRVEVGCGDESVFVYELKVLLIVVLQGLSSVNRKLSIFHQCRRSQPFLSCFMLDVY
jgi:hypothetical protein